MLAQIVLALLAVVTAELAVVLGAQAWRTVRAIRPRREDAEDGEESTPDVSWQEGMSAVMGYDLAAAKKAVRRDRDESGDGR